MTMTNLQLSAHAFLTRGTPWHTRNVTVPTEDWHLELILLPPEPAYEERRAIHIPISETVTMILFTVTIQRVLCIYCVITL